MKFVMDFIFGFAKFRLLDAKLRTSKVWPPKNFGYRNFFQKISKFSIKKSTKISVKIFSYTKMYEKWKFPKIEILWSKVFYRIFWRLENFRSGKTQIQNTDDIQTSTVLSFCAVGTSFRFLQLNHPVCTTFLRISVLLATQKNVFFVFRVQCWFAKIIWFSLKHFDFF